MESIYYVMSWLCHRQCEHCYEDRFRPYYGEDLQRVAGEARSNFRRIIGNLPDRLTYLDPADGFQEKTGRIILSGGEVLLEATRESVLYPGIELLQEKYRGHGGVRIIVQTTGDILNERYLHELLDRGVWLVSISGMDEFHEGFEEEAARQRQIAKLTGWFEKAGMKPSEGRSAQDPMATGPLYHFFGATPESWIGKLWPRGRAWKNELSQAGIVDNFCNAWSGGLGFLAQRYRGSEVSIDPEGNVYPCCIKTKKALGSLLDTKLDVMLRSLEGNPVYEAIAMGHPERMGITSGWTEEMFYEKSKVTLPSGRVYQNVCIGCDTFHDEVLARELVQIG